MPRPNLIVFGYDELLLASLDFFAKTDARISAVVFPSNRTDWRANKIREIVAEKGFLMLEQPPRKEIAGFAEKLRRFKPDLIYVWSYPMILPAEILKSPKRGCVNLHFGLLPEYRGVNGVRWALLNGEEKTGVTLHLMDGGIDTGDILARVSFPITDADDILSLMKKSKMAGLHLLENCWQQIASGKAHAIPQNESQARYFSGKMSALETIDWSKPNVEIHNLIRASAFPLAGVCSFWNGRKLVFRKSVLIGEPRPTEEFGSIEKIDSGGVEIATGRGNLLVTEIEIGGSALRGAELTALGLKVGGKFQDS